MIKRIPEHEPEVIKARARGYGGDDEKVATASMERIRVGGIWLDSRYGKAHELNAMIEMLSIMPANVNVGLSRIFIDSKATWSFIVTLRRRLSVARLDCIKSALDNAAKQVVGGHNGIWIDLITGARREYIAEVGADWT